MTLTEKGYKKRLIDKKMKQLLDTFGAISIEGPKWCGKTWTMLNHSNSVSYLMDETTRMLAEINSKTALEGEYPHAIDEWQVVPSIWDAVRFTVDKNVKRGQFLLSGSVTPPEKGRLHSGIGRISTVRMRTLSLYESGDSTGDISLKDLMDGIEVLPKRSKLEVEDLISLSCKGGWPLNLGIEIESPFELPKDYLNSVINNNFADSDDMQVIRIREKEKFRFFLASLARNNASIVKNATIHNEVNKATDEFSKSTLAEYLQHLRNIFLLEEIPGWHPQIRSTTRILSSPKRFFTDPSLAVAALGANPGSLIKDMQTFGGIFEGLCLRDLLIYSEAISSRVFHYRDDSNLEVDAIIEKEDGAWGAFEIKLGGKSSINVAAKSLLKLRDKMIKAGSPKPVCMVVLTASQASLPREDGVMVVPIGMLKS